MKSTIASLLRCTSAAGILALGVVGLQKSAVPQAATDLPDGAIVKLEFDPKRDGYSFPNYPENSAVEPDFQNPELTDADVYRLFGKDVCVGEKTNPCILTASARKWQETQITAMTNGHCEGMAVTSLLLNAEKSGTPANSLQLDPKLKSYIARYFVMQTLDEVAKPAAELREGFSPTQIKDELVRSLRDRQELYTIGMYIGEGKDDKYHLTQGHTVTPFAIENTGNGKYRVSVYDSNLPNTTQFLEIDTTNNSWFYQPQGASQLLYQSEANRKTLELAPLSARRSQIFKCPFCQTNPATQPIEVFSDDGGDLLIQEYDYSSEKEEVRGEIGFVNGEFINTYGEIASNKPFRSGFGDRIPPVYVVPPLKAPGNVYTISLTGQKRPQKPNRVDSGRGSGIVGNYLKQLDSGRSSGIVGNYLNRQERPQELNRVDSERSFSTIENYLKWLDSVRNGIVENYLNRQKRPQELNRVGAVRSSGYDSKPNLTIVGPGYVVGFTDIPLDADDAMVFGFTPDYQDSTLYLTFESLQKSTASPGIFIAVDDERTGYSYIFELGSINVPPKKGVVMQLNIARGTLEFFDRDRTSDTYNLTILQINPNGKVTEFNPTAGDISLSGKGKLSFADGNLNLRVDANGDGNLETAVPLKGGCKKKCPAAKTKPKF